MRPPVEFEGVWKRFRLGERHDSIRDLLPAFARRIAGRSAGPSESEFWAIRDVSFSVKPGEALGIIGPNGAGKSTTLKLLTRILKPTRGSCRLDGRVGALIEVAAGFHPDLTGRENVFLQGAIMGMKREEIASRFDEIVAFSGVASFIDTPVKRYSSGMNARLGFSIAAHLNPQILIIDEVLAVGDLAFQEKCFERMQSFLREGVAIVLVSHNLTAVGRLCRTALMLNGGEQTAYGPSTEVIAEYCRSQARASTSNDKTPTVSLRMTNSDLSMRTIEPGSHVRLRVELTYHTFLRAASIGVIVWDMTNGLYVYGVTSDALNLPPLVGTPGTTAIYDFEFCANLARGTYGVEIHVFDSDRHEHLARLMPATQFTVLEQVTYGGVANLFLTGSVVDSSVAGGLPEATEDITASAETLQ